MQKPQLPTEVQLKSLKQQYPPVILKSKQYCTIKFYTLFKTFIATVVPADLKLCPLYTTPKPPSPMISL